MGDRVVGGTVYHLTDRVDGGPVALQRYAVVAPHTPASTLWRDTLAPMGLEMLREAAVLGSGRLPCRPQDDSVATWEPALDAAPVYRPELLELTAALR
jgi:methionyl-tRNA formyltransferase